MSRHARRGTRGEQDWGPEQPERWAAESWDSGSWDQEHWEPPSWGGADDPGAGGPAGELAPLPPSSVPGPGHPSGPLPPLPPAEYDWHAASGATPPVHDAPYEGPSPGAARYGEARYGATGPRQASRYAAPDHDAAAGYPPGPAGYQPGPAGYQPGPGSYPPGPDGYPADPYPGPPGDYQDERGYPGEPASYAASLGQYPAGPGGYPGEPDSYLDPPETQPRRGRRARRSDADAADTGFGGYVGYVDHPDDPDPRSPQDPGGYPAAGGWYGDVEESRTWAEEDYGNDLLPGLDEHSGGRPAAGTPVRRRRRRGRVAILASLLVFVVILAAGGAVGYHYYRVYINPPDFPGPGSGSVVVTIKPGDPASVVGQRLAALGVVASARAFSNAAKDSPRGNALEPGTYRVRKHMKASLALALLLSPASRVQAKVTIPEGFRLSQIIALLGKETGNPKGYQQAIAAQAALGLPAFAHGKAEGYLFPATYEIQPKTPPVTVLKSMVSQFSQEAASIGLPAAAARAHESQSAVITVASLLEAEGKRPQDYPKIAEVIYNRLNAVPQIKLQLDTTVLYAMSLKHSNAPFSTTFPSPYNTYAHAGLPPGPIDSPGKAAIEAALHPAHGNYLYFLTINSTTGQTLFFSTAHAFDAAVAKYGSTGTGTGTHTGGH